MPNIHETIKQLAIEAGGPGSGRKPGFDFKHKNISTFKKNDLGKMTQPGEMHSFLNGHHVATTSTRMESKPYKKLYGKVSLFKDKKTSYTTYHRAAIAQASGKDISAIPETYHYSSPLNQSMNLSKKDIEDAIVRSIK